MITKEQVTNLSRRWGIDQFSIIREYIQTLFLFHIFNLKDSEHLYFKGGTAIRLLLGSFRFSEDLDFSSTLDAKSLSKLIKNALYGLKKELASISLAPVRSKRNSLVTCLKFIAEETTHPLNIHLEISLREKPIQPVTSQLESLYPVSPYPFIRHLGWEEILAEKVRACFIRAKSRDLFDIWYLLTKEVRLNWPIINKKMAYYQKTVSARDLIKRIEGLRQDNFVKDLAKFLPSDQRPMLKELKAKLLAKLKS